MQNILSCNETKACFPGVSCAPLQMMKGGLSVGPDWR